MNSIKSQPIDFRRLVPEGTRSAALVVDKPAGVTSHDVVAMVRRSTGMKVGHAGTLDPFATGLLLILLGRATRLQRYLAGLPKRYVARARLGWTSSTGDPDGDLNWTGNVPDDLALPVGEIEQMVPLTSAVKVDGERLYRKAHRGEDQVERPIRKVVVHTARLVNVERGQQGVPERAEFEVEVSSGTYVRTLIETLGDAYCEELRRTSVGSIELSDGERVVPLPEVLSFMPSVELRPDEKREIAFGRSLSLPVMPEDGGGPICLTFGSSVIAIARESDGRMRPEVVLEPA